MTISDFPKPPTTRRRLMYLLIFRVAAFVCKKIAKVGVIPMIVTSVHDVVADRFLGFNLVDNEQVAIRGFKNALEAAQDDRESLYCTNPSDFDLYYLGVFDEVDGTFTDLDHPRVLYRGSTFVAERKYKDE